MAQPETEAPTAAPDKKVGRVGVKRVPGAATSAALRQGTAALGTVSGGATTLPEAGVLLEGEIGAAALAAAAADAATVIRGATPEDPRPVLLTGRADQAQVVLAGAALRAALDVYLADADRLLATPLPDPADGSVGDRRIEETGGEGGAGAPALATATPLGAALAAGAALLNAVAVETSVAATERTVGELQTHVAVLSALLRDGVDVIHDSLSVPPTESSLLDAVGSLRSYVPRLEARAAEAKTAIARLGKDPAPDEVGPLAAHLTAAQALADSIRTFLAEATAVDDAGLSPLLAGLQAERLTSGGATHVAVVLPAQLSTHQITLRRKIFATRVVVTASARIDVLVLDIATGRVAAAAPARGVASFQVRFPMWWGWWGGEDKYLPRYQPVSVAAALPGGRAG